MNSGLAQVCHSTASTSKEIRLRPSSSRTASRSFAAATIASTGASSPGRAGSKGYSPSRSVPSSVTPRNSFRYSGVQPSTRPPVNVPGFRENSP